MQEEIFGPVLVSLTFRTPSEAIELANNTRYGLAASVWSDNINLALDVASKIKAGSVWVNCTNLFDGAAGFGGYRESGYGREGGKEGLFEYVRPTWMDRPRPEFVPMNEEVGRTRAYASDSADGCSGKWTFASADRSHAEDVRRRQAGATRWRIHLNDIEREGKIVGQVGDGNRKDIRNAVEAAHKARTSGWAMRHGFNRSQILYFIAENLDARNAEFVERIVEMTGRTKKSAQAEVDAAVERLFTYAAWADKYGGTVQETTLRGITVGVNEPDRCDRHCLPR